METPKQNTWLDVAGGTKAPVPVPEVIWVHPELKASFLVAELQPECSDDVPFVRQSAVRAVEAERDGLLALLRAVRSSYIEYVSSEMTTVQVPNETWRLVEAGAGLFTKPPPREPTLAMLIAGEQPISDMTLDVSFGEDTYRKIWQAMYDAGQSE